MVDVEELYNIGTDYWKKEQYNQAKIYFKLASKQGHVMASTMLGYFYEKWCEDIDTKFEKAAKYYEMAAKKSENNAQNNLGLLHLECMELFNIKNAKKYFKLAVAQNNIEALYNLGCTYSDNSITTNIKIEKAIKYFELAAEKGHGGAIVSLGDIYYDGDYVEKDLIKAVNYYELYLEKTHDFIHKCFLEEILNSEEYKEAQKLNMRKIKKAFSEKA